MSRILETLIGRLQELKADIAVSSLQRPYDANIEFNYGKAVGLVAGLELAEKLVLEVLSNDKGYV